ncbi:predicted protein [Histoplasma capsulatum G186AR]|uniref:Uncharacterized protein n=1 Tax=Ajellomyces capsulatus (strain G186AR / H82 / ATCC MYA-2454 / RMSCC 2432) TaxID=447093 RepID=C0NWH4_AJECG|nr:uncharacterized protein HCBG_07504 [Histoplasma capsulatum G186AR]EEH04279.1 predicted protein [Histoplasma capsulatum G186AR]
MATSAMGLNSHACDAPHGIPQRTSVGQKNLRQLDLRITPMALRAPQLNCERPEPDTTSLYTSCLVSDGELQRRHASISIASIIDKYAQIPDDNRYHNFFQVAENNRIPENSQNRACDGSSFGGFRSGSLWYRMQDNDPAATKGPIVPGPSWKYPQRNGPGDVADCSYGPLIDPYVEAREKQELYLGVEKIRSSGSASSSRPSLDVKYQEPWTQKSEHAREGQQTESSYSPTDSSHTSQPSLMTSSTSPWPAKTRNVDDLSPNTVSRPVRDNNVPSDTTQGSNDNLSRMLKRWALLDQQNIGLVDRVPFRSYSARERLHDHLNAHTEDCTTNGGYVESPDAEVDGLHSRDVFGRPCLQQRTYSESIYSRPTTLQPVPVDWRSGNEKYTGQGYSSSLRRYHQRSYGSSKAGPSQPTPPMPFINAAVNESCEDNTYNKLDSRPQIVQRKKSYSCQFYLGRCLSLGNFWTGWCDFGNARLIPSVVSSSTGTVPSVIQRAMAPIICMDSTIYLSHLQTAVDGGLVHRLGLPVTAAVVCAEFTTNDNVYCSHEGCAAWKDWQSIAITSPPYRSHKPKIKAAQSSHKIVFVNTQISVCHGAGVGGWEVAPAPNAQRPQPRQVTNHIIMSDGPLRASINTSIPHRLR